jgi:hypothetical protein
VVSGIGGAGSSIIATTPSRSSKPASTMAINKACDLFMAVSLANNYYHYTTKLLDTEDPTLWKMIRCGIIFSKEWCYGTDLADHGL